MSHLLLNSADIFVYNVADVTVRSRQWSFPKAKSAVFCLRKEGQDFAQVIKITWQLSLKSLKSVVLFICLKLRHSYNYINTVEKQKLCAPG